MSEEATDGGAVVEPTEAPNEAIAEEAEAPAQDVDSGEDGPISLDEPTSLDEPETVAEDDEGETGEEGEEADEDAEPETVEFDFSGNKKAFPKNATMAEIADEVQGYVKSIEADYTRKSQANAEQAKVLATRAEAVEKITSINGEALQTYSRGLQVRQEIEQLAQVDVNALWQSNPDQARRVSDMLAAKQAEFQNIVATVGQQEAALDEAQQGELVRRMEEGKATLDRRIKNFSTEKAPEVVAFVVKEFGMAQADADKWAANPDMTQMAYESMMYRRMQAGAKKPAAKPTQAKPMTAMKAKGAASGSVRDPGKMSDAQFRKHLGLA